MAKLLLLTGAAIRSRLRWARQHIYSWLILGPLVLGLTYFTASRMAANLPPWQPSLSVALALATLLVLCMVGMSLSRASVEIYHLRQPESFFESLPVAASTHLNAALINRIARTSVVGVLILIARSLSGGSRWTDGLLPLALFIVLTSLIETLAGLNWIHWGHTKDRIAASIALIILLPISLLPGLLLVFAFRPNELKGSRPLWYIVAIASAAIIYLLLHRSHNSWRASDIEYAKRLQTAGRRSLFWLASVLRRFDAKVAAQLARDLQLTFRAFSSAVYVVLGMTVLWVALLLTALTANLLPLAEGVIPFAPDDASGFNATWLPPVMGTKLACVLIVSTLAALMPVLVAYELPHLWLERAAGTTGLDIWEAKLWYARLVSMPAPLVAWLAGMASGEVPLFYSLPLLAECFWLWWLASSIIGSLSFEMPNRPGLAIIVVVTLGVAGGIFSALLWPFGLIIYFQAMHGLTQRGRARVRYYLMTEGD